MGLDWQPTARSKSGHEAEFESIYSHIHEDSPIEVPPRTKWGLFRDRRAEAAERKAILDAMEKRFGEIGIFPHEVVGAPQVGHDPAADEWLAKEVERRKKRNVDLPDLIAEMRGYYVVALAPESDGLPVYSNGWIPGSYCEPYTFRAQFLGGIDSWLDHDLIAEAWKNHRVLALLDYGRRLRAKAIEFADARGVSREVLEVRKAKKREIDAPALQAHIVMSAAKWCQWWGERGHGMIAWY